MGLSWAFHIVTCVTEDAKKITQDSVLCSDDYLPVATTRPETLLGDTAVAVHPEVCLQSLSSEHNCVMFRFTFLFLTWQLPHRPAMF